MINFNGYDFSEDIRVTAVKRPVLPPSLLTTTSIMGRTGSLLFYKQFGSYVIPVSFMLLTKSHAELRQKVRDLADKLDTDEPAKLIFSDEPDKYINAIVSDESDLSEVASYGQGEISFYCPDPYWYAINDDIIIKTAAGLYEFTRKGTAESYPIIEVKGTNSSGAITISNESTTMKYSGALNSGETLVLDSDLITAYILKTDGSKVPVLDKLDNLDFPVLKKGSNELAANVSGGATISNVKITCRSRWK